MRVDLQQFDLAKPDNAQKVLQMIDNKLATVRQTTSLTKWSAEIF